MTRLLDNPQAFVQRLRACLSAQPPNLHGEGLRPAAVLIALLPSGSGWQVLFTRRSAQMPEHGGEISFPGGRLKAGESPEAAALREAQEEVGLKPHTLLVAGFASACRTASGHIIAPLVAVAPQPVALRPCPREVAEAFCAPLDHFRSAATWRREQRRGRHYHVAQWQGRIIWGATAAMLRDLIQRLEAGGAP